MSGSVAQYERQHNESLPESLFKSQNGKKIVLNSPSAETPVSVKPEGETSAELTPSISLDQVLRSCPDIREVWCERNWHMA